MTALETLRALAGRPSGARERELESAFAGIAGIGEAADALCKLFLVYRQDGFFKMLSPSRLYFLASEQALVSYSGSDTVHGTVAENIQYTRRDVVGQLFSFCRLCFCRVTTASFDQKLKS